MAHAIKSSQALQHVYSGPEKDVRNDSSSEELKCLHGSKLDTSFTKKSDQFAEKEETGSDNELRLCYFALCLSKNR